MALLVFFHESRIQLAQELKLHPELAERVNKHPADEFELKLAEVAAYCGILLDDLYYKDDIDKLCEYLYWELRRRRTGLDIVRN